MRSTQTQLALQGIIKVTYGDAGHGNSCNHCNHISHCKRIGKFGSTSWLSIDFLKRGGHPAIAFLHSNLRPHQSRRVLGRSSILTHRRFSPGRNGVRPADRHPSKTKYP
jgi:hypothetical protein